MQLYRLRATNVQHKRNVLTQHVSWDAGIGTKYTGYFDAHWVFLWPSCAQDPLNCMNNVGRSSFGIGQVQRALFEALTTLKAKMVRVNQDGKEVRYKIEYTGNEVDTQPQPPLPYPTDLLRCCRGDCYRYGGIGESCVRGSENCPERGPLSTSERERVTIPKCSPLEGCQAY